MIIDLTQTKIERQMVQPLLNEQKEGLIAQLLSTEEELIAATKPRRCPKLRGGNAYQYICRHGSLDGFIEPY